MENYLTGMFVYILFYVMFLAGGISANKIRDNESTFTLLLAGGLVGAALWPVSLPIYIFVLVGILIGRRLK